MRNLLQTTSLAAVKFLAALFAAIREEKREGRIPDPDHVREYTESSLSALLERLNVSEICFHDIDPRRFVVSCRIGK